MGSAWDAIYLPAIRALSRNVIVRGVYDAVPARAELTAREWQTVASPSLTSLYERPDIDAVLLLDNAWHGWFALDLACRYKKPTLITGPWRGELEALEHWQEAAREAGVLLMAACPRRHAPSTNRLRELLATKLGAARSIAAEVSWPAATAQEELIGVIDWCGCVLGRAPNDVAYSSEGHAGVGSVSLRFPAADLAAEIRLCRTSEGASSEHLRIEAQHGSALITGPSELSWLVDGQEHRETLTSDRPSAQIIVDQFCRRVAGGLVPVPHLADLLNSIRHARTIAALWV
jgi:predicted dehydrogenase